MSICHNTPCLVYNILKVSYSMQSLSSWYIRERPKPHSDNQFSCWLLYLRWSGLCPSTTPEQDAIDQSLLPESLPWAYFMPGSIPTSFIYFLSLLLFLCLLNVNDLQGPVPWTFCFFSLHILLIQLFVADDSQICISSLAIPAETNRYFQSLLGFLVLHWTSCNLPRYLSPFYFLSKFALPTVFPVFPST